MTRFLSVLLIALLAALPLQAALAQQPAAQPQATQPAPPAQQPSNVQAPAQQPPAQQAPAQQAPAQQSDAAKTLQAAQQVLSRLTDRVEEGRADDNRLAELKAQADDLSGQVAGLLDSSRTRLDQIKGRLTELGDPPADGAPPEAAIVTEERNRLLQERTDLNAVTGSAESVQEQANSLSASITEIRRALFANTLLRHTDISLDTFADAGTAFLAEREAFTRNLTSWLSFVLSYKRLPLFSAVSLSLLAALVLLLGTRRLFSPVIKRTTRDVHPSYLARLSVAFWSTMIPTIAAGTFAATCYFLLMTFNVLRPDISPVVRILLGISAGLQFIWTISTAVLAPGQSTWRLVRVSDRGAVLLVAAILAMAVVNSADYLLETISVTLASPLVLTVVKSLIASIIIGLILMSLSLLKPVIPQGEPLDAQGRPWPRWLSFLLFFAGLGLIFAALSGYVGLARFIATQIVVTTAIFVTMYIGILSGKAIAKQDALAKTVVGRYLARRFRLEQVALDQIGLLTGLLIYVLVACFFIPLFLLQWGFKIADIESGAYQLLTNIQVGTISISIISIFAGILLFVLGFLITRWFQRWLDRSVMARSRADAGVRNSVKTGVGYLGMGLAGLIGISAAGLNLSSLALVAGALSLGVGFGLQNIVSNFVSGLILLVERPFKVGDWVISGTTEGYVKRISVRATEVETFQRQTIMVPNSLFINASVGNWTHRNKLGRVDVPFTVHASNDPRKVVQVLKAVAQDCQTILRNPEPQVVFMGFTADKLDFEVRAFVADILSGVSVRTELRLLAFERFKTDGVALGGPAAPEVPVKISPDDAALLSDLFRGLRPGRLPEEAPEEEEGEALPDQPTPEPDVAEPEPSAAQRPAPQGPGHALSARARRRARQGGK